MNRHKGDDGVSRGLGFSAFTFVPGDPGGEGEAAPDEMAADIVPRVLLNGHRLAGIALGEAGLEGANRTFEEWTQALAATFTVAQCRELLGLLLRFEAMLDRRDADRRPTTRGH